MRIKFEDLNGGEPYDIYYVTAIDIPGEIRIGSIVMKVTGTPLEKIDSPQTKKRILERQVIISKKFSSI